MLTLADIKGVGSATIKKLNDLDIHNVFEVFSFLPKKYIDLQEPNKVLDVQIGQLSLFEGRVERVSSIQAFGAKSFFVTFSDNLANNRVYFKATFYNMPFLHDSFEEGQSYRMLARLQNDKGVIEVVNPVLEKVEKISKLKGIFSVYPLRNVFGQSAFKNIVYSALDLVKNTRYEGRMAGVNNDFIKYFELAHRPKSLDDSIIALNKLASIDLAIVLSLYRKVRKNAQKQRKVFYNLHNFRIVEYISALGFSPTPSQMQACEDIASDLTSKLNMSRVISGDVGSGKTAVAFYAMYLAAFCGHQSCIMAPTEILAKQHASKFSIIAEKLGIKFALLTSSTTKKERKEILSGLKNGEIQCLIGTNAVVSDDVEYKDLTLAIIDEQHRFGVNERGKLEKKGASDILSLTATPIPRSLALTFYEDIAISRIEKREDAKTNVVTSVSSSIDNILANIVESVRMGKQAFIVCPSIEDAEGNQTMSIESFMRDYGKYFDNLNSSIMHGKLSNEVKSKIMNDFSNGRTQILIATTVIEVGIDTRASEIAIINADRFGLATLHQLRGRVGRDGSLAHCYLHSFNQGERAMERLDTLTHSNDGQYLAEIDFKMRGAGDFIGVRQSGVSSTPIFDLQMTADILRDAKTYADKNLSHLDERELLALTHCAKCKVHTFIEELNSVTLNS